MAPLFTKFCGRASLIALEILAVVAGLLALGAGLLIWRLNSGPLDITFAKNYVQQEMYDPESGYSLTLGEVTTSWPDLKGPLMLRLHNVSVLKDGRTILNVGAMELGLSKRALLLGQVAPQGVVLSHPSLRLLRTADNNIVLSLRDELPDVTPADGNADDGGALMDTIRRLAGPPPRGERGGPFDRLRSLEIRDARMVMEDHVQGMTWYLPNIDLLFMRDRQGLVLTADMMLPSDADNPARITADIAYNRERDDIAARLALRHVDPHILTGKFGSLDFLADHDLSVSGELTALLDGNLAVQDVALNLTAAPGALVLPDLYDEPFAFDAVGIAARYDRDTQSLTIDRAAVTAHDVTVNLAAALSATPEKIDGHVTLSIPTLPQDKITHFWPDSARDSSAATWLTEHISGGSFADIEAGFDLRGALLPAADGAREWDVDASNITATLALVDSRVDYRAPLPAAENVQATGRYENDTLTVTINEATVGGLKAGQSTVELTALIQGTPGHVNINVNLTGPVGAVFSYIEKEPIGMTGAQLGLDVAAARGQAALAVGVSFPALRDLPAEKVKVKVDGTLTEAYVPGVVKNLAATGGPLKLTVDNEMVKLSGKALLDGRDTTFAWEQYLESKGKPWSGKVEASLIADKDLRDKLGVTLDDWMAGAAPVNLTYIDYGDGRAEARVRADLHNSRVTVGPVKYEKPPGLPASATATVLLKGGQLQEVSKLTVQTPDLYVDNARLLFRTEGGQTIFTRGTFPHATLGENDLALELESARDGTLKVSVNGAFFDAQPFMRRDTKPGEASAPYAGPPVFATINARRMRTAPRGTVDNVKAYLDLGRNGDINKLELDAVAGRGAVYFRLRPNQAGRMTLRLEADDAGATLNAFGLYENIAGGRLIIAGEANNPQQPRVLGGQVQLNDFRAVNAPILARLVSAISPTGIAELLGSDGISFARLESDFEWHMRKQGDLYLVKNGRTSGAAMGLTFEGQVDGASQQINITGHVVPVSMLNSFISSIPIVGTILSGGSEGGVFAATYSVSGPQKNPTVSVNPLSVLTPGIIRRILFENE